MNINNEILKINTYLKKQLWMDFEIYKSNAGEMILSGFLDEMESDKLKIIFHRPYMIICTMCFTFEGGNRFVDLLEGEKAREINKKYGVTQGNNIFKIINTNINSDMYVIAEGIEVKIMELSN